MYLRFAAVLAALTVSMPLLAQEAPADKEKLSYAIGFQFGTDIRFRNLDVHIEILVRGAQT